ncbi:MAG TPA: heparan N-sulfatase, partial [Planctomycetaceae bacterium]|nr:heparan N-sulfatase [Planctomycetaceae bacterium]
MCWLRWTVVVVLLLGSSMGRAAAAEKNIVLFVADDLGTDLGCYGHPVVQSPHIDQFAREGILFRNAFATTASCSASRSVILTGLYNHANGHFGHQHSWHHFSSFDWVKSLPWFLEQGGYRTARVGKYHVAPESVYTFQQNLGGFGRDVVKMVNAAKPLFKEKTDKPFFLYICTSDPHRGGSTVSSDPLAANRFGNKARGSYTGIQEVTYRPEDVVVPPFLPDTPECRGELAQYYQAVSRVDQGFGYLLQALKDAGVYDQTLILLISDHGIAMPGAKTTVYEPGLQSPCIVRLPGGQNGGQQTEALINWADLTPTILDFAGLLDSKANTFRLASLTMPARPGGRPHPKTPYRFHGQSFLPTLHHPDS